MALEPATTAIKHPFGALLALAALACGGSDLVLPGPNPPGQPSTPADIVIVKGNAQSGAPGAALAESIVVKVTDSTGAPLAGQRVQFVPDAPGAAVTPQTSATGADGTAGATWVLGATAGLQEVVAQIVGVSALLQVRFIASAETSSASALAIRTAPSPSALLGVPLDRQPVVQLQDDSGREVKSKGVAVTAAVASGAGVLGGATTVLTDKSGRAQFADLRIDGATGSHVLIFVAAGYTSVSSSPIDVRD